MIGAIDGIDLGRYAAVGRGDKPRVVRLLYLRNELWKSLSLEDTLMISHREHKSLDGDIT